MQALCGAIGESHSVHAERICIRGGGDEVTGCVGNGARDVDGDAGDGASEANANVDGGECKSLPAALIMLQT